MLRLCHCWWCVISYERNPQNISWDYAPKVKRSRFRSLSHARARFCSLIVRLILGSLKSVELWWVLRSENLQLDYFFFLRWGVWGGAKSIWGLGSFISGAGGWGWLIEPWLSSVMEVRGGNGENQKAPLKTSCSVSHLFIQARRIFYTQKKKKKKKLTAHQPSRNVTRTLQS